MGILKRGIKDAFRNGVRSVAIILILSVSLSMALVMLIALRTVTAKIGSVKSSIGNTITISPAGVRGFEGGGELLTDSNATDVAALANVAKVTKVMTDRLTSADTNLVSSIEPGSFGDRQSRRTGESYGPPPEDTSLNRNSGSTSSTGAQRTFLMPIQVMATSDFGVASSLGVSEFKITAGANFATDSTERIALVGSDLATKNSLAVDSTFSAYGQIIKVVGIYDTGNKFSNSSIVLPIATLQKFSEQTGQYSSFIVQTNSIDSLEAVTNAIKSKLGSSADVVSSQDTSASAVKPLENIRTISLYSLVGSLAAGAIIIFLVMTMIVRERRREIGVLKAIGSTNLGIMGQFTIESMILTLISSLVGVVLGFFLSNPVLRVLISNTESSQNTVNFAPGAGRGAAMLARIGGGIGNTREILQNLQATVGIEIVLYGLLAALVIAILGSAIPAYFIAKVRPAEVMRQE
jgi:putative ABC transport system permease protein